MFSQTQSTEGAQCKMPLMASPRALAMAEAKFDGRHPEPTTCHGGRDGWDLARLDPSKQPSTTSKCVRRTRQHYTTLHYTPVGVPFPR